MKNIFSFLLITFSSLAFGQTDYCTSAPSLTVGATCSPTNFNVVGTFLDNFTSEPSCGTNYRDGFFQFTATTTNSTVTLTDAASNGPNPGVMVLSGNCGSGSFTEIACSDNANGVTETMSFTTTIGQTYFIVIFRSNNANLNDMTGTVCVTGSNVPDEPCSAQPLTVGTSCTYTSGNNTNATDSPILDPGCAWYAGSDVWYSVVVPAGGAVTIDMQSGTMIDGGMAVYNGTCNALLFIDCDDDSSPNGSMPQLFINGQVPGSTLWIRVWGYAGELGSFGICVTEAQTVVTASDCPQYVDVCTDLGFEIDPNGSGLINEIPALGSYGNPDYDGLFNLNPWGTYNYGCLRVGESNSTWMVINISGSGDLEFTFGGNSTQTGYYDWIMYPYTDLSTCNAISSNTVAPVRCNWNSVDYGGTGLASTIPFDGDFGNYEPPLAVTAGQKYIICFSNWSSVATNVPLQFGGTAVVSCQPLGVNLFDYTVDCEENEHLLEWKTSHEENFSHFEVQRMNEQQQWEIMSQINNPVHEEGTTRVYRFQIEARTAEIQYYRLKMIDVNGDFEYSDIKSVLCSKTIQNNTLAPNPSKDFTNLIYYSNSIGTLEIMDQTGRLIQHYTLENTGKRMVEKVIDVQDLKEGVYYFMLNIDDQVTTLPFIKQ